MEGGYSISVMLGCIVCTCLLAGERFKSYNTASVSDEMESAAKVRKVIRIRALKMKRLEEEIILRNLTISRMGDMQLDYFWVQDCEFDEINGSVMTNSSFIDSSLINSVANQTYYENSENLLTLNNSTFPNSTFIASKKCIQPSDIKFGGLKYFFEYCDFDGLKEIQILTGDFTSRVNCLKSEFRVIKTCGFSVVYENLLNELPNLRIVQGNAFGNFNFLDYGNLLPEC